MDIMQAVQTFIVKLNQPAIAHAIWVRTQADPETHEFIRDICIAVRPSYRNRMTIPLEHEGYPITQIPWPKDA